MLAAVRDTDSLTSELRRRAGKTLDPSIVDLFAANSGALIEEISSGDPRTRLLEDEPAPLAEIAEPDIPVVAAAFGDLGDLKTPFTHGHSSGVAELAVAAAERLRLDRVIVARLRIAALLHDLGHVGVSNAVWEKAGPLTAAQWEQARMHPCHSERILATSPVLAPMATIAGLHHERQDGSGYHRGCSGTDIPAGARVLAAADAFQAMTQRRPHRPALDSDRASHELQAEARAGRFDPDVVVAVLEAAGHPRPGSRRKLRPGGLSEREIEVLRLLAEGCSNPDIGRRLEISRRTAEHHVQHIYTKIGVATRPAAALFALEHDLLRSPHRS